MNPITLEYAVKIPQTTASCGRKITMIWWEEWDADRSVENYVQVDLPRLGWPDGVDGVVAAEEEVVDRRPRPANKWTQSKPLTPLVRSPPVLPSPKELNKELVELGVPTVGGFSILYLRNSAQKSKNCKHMPE